MQVPNETLRAGEKKLQLNTAVRLTCDLPSFLAWYFGAFIFAALLWHLSTAVWLPDVLELPTTAFYFPLAGFLDPNDGMVNDRNTFFYAIAFWGAVVPLALWLTPKRPLFTALAIIGMCSIASVAYVVFRALTRGPAELCSVAFEVFRTLT